MTHWNHPGFDLRPVAEAIGPFCTRDFIAAVSRRDAGSPLPAADDGAFIPLRVVDDEIMFAGDGEVTDYHSPLGDRSDALIAEVARSHSPSRLVLDSLPEEAAKPLVAGLEASGWAVETRVHEVAAVLDLPDSFDRYMDDIGKKERHEIRRKRRRFQRMVGEIRHETHRGPGWAFEEFLRLHRLAEGDKGEFMTGDREAFFADLVELDGWRFDLLRTPQDTAAAVVFGFVDETGYYLYNSAYDVELGRASPGVVLLGTMIEQAIAEGLARFDFLKGDEQYKFRLGARRRPLTEIVATRGNE